MESVMSESNQSLPSDLLAILDSSYLEHDAFIILCRLMYHVEPWYGNNKLFKDVNPPEVLTKNTAASMLDGRMPRSEADCENEHIDVKLTRIHEILLKNVDFELYNHLKRNDIIPQVYGIRWLRLLFGREFSLQDCLSIWDTIFHHCHDFNAISKLTDYIFIAMLLEIKPLLINSDEQQCVQILMKFPPIEDISSIIKKAKGLMDSDKLFSQVEEPNQIQFDMNEINSKASNAVDTFTKDVNTSILEMKSRFSK